MRRGANPPHCEDSYREGPQYGAHYDSRHQNIAASQRFQYSREGYEHPRSARQLSDWPSHEITEQCLDHMNQPRPVGENWEYSGYTTLTPERLAPRRPHSALQARRQSNRPSSASSTSRFQPTNTGCFVPLADLHKHEAAFSRTSGPDVLNVIQHPFAPSLQASLQKVHAWFNVCMGKKSCMLACACVCACVCASVHPCIRACVRACVRPCVRGMHARAHTHRSLCVLGFFDDTAWQCARLC